MFSSLAKNFSLMNQTNKVYFSKSPQFIHSMTADKLLCELPKPRKRTKTVCTIGPRSQDPIMAGKLIDQGLNVARLNFSHGDYEEHVLQVDGVLKALESRPNSHVSILLDTKGPEIRTGNNLDGKQIQLKRGQLLEITTDYEHQGTSEKIACSYKDLCESTEVGKKILIADGGISTKVVKKSKGSVTVQVLNDGKIGSKKNMCLPGCVVNLPTITKRDEADCIEFGLKHKVDFIAVSFARRKKDLDDLRKLLIEHDPEHGPYIQLISKIENHQAIHNLDEIIEGSDGIMVARGDLGMEVPIQKVVILQKYITERTINAGKIAITATQMLESMESKPRPTRAQISDITNSVYDLTDANMTSGQTTVGLFPEKCAGMLRKVAQQAEASCDYKKVFQYRKNLSDDRECVGLVSLTFELGCDFIFLKTDNIRLISRISSLRPKAYLIVFTDQKQVKGAVSVNFGVYCYPIGENTNPAAFIQNHGFHYGFNTDQRTRILSVQSQNDRIVSSRIYELN